MANNWIRECLQDRYYVPVSDLANINCNSGAVFLVPCCCICQDLAVDELRIRGATSLLGRLGRTDCVERNNTQEI